MITNSYYVIFKSNTPFHKQNFQELTYDIAKSFNVIGELFCKHCFHCKRKFIFKVIVI